MRRISSLVLLGSLLGCTLLINQQLRNPICGDGFLDDEDCDDANTDPGDGCNNACAVEPNFSCSGQPSQCRPIDTTCGDSVKEGLEECDDGNGSNGDGCSSLCFNEFCGDSIIQDGLGEECDDGNQNPNDGCSPFCTTEGCGDGFLQPGEVCDDNNTIAGDGCRADCRGDESCGDNFFDPAAGETCDDDNITNGDGCSDICTIDLASLCNVNVNATVISAGLNGIAGRLSSDSFDDPLCPNGSPGFEKAFLVVFSVGGLLDVTVTPIAPAVDLDLILYFRDNGCENQSSTTICQDELGGGQQEKIIDLQVTAGQTGTFFVDSPTNTIGDFNISFNLQ